jgi:phosphatidylglycerol:prolipoprotein diacylglycerol transferase
MIHIGIDPVAFTIGSFEVRWYGIFIALSIVTMVVWVWRFGRRAGVSPELLLGSVTVAIPAGLVVSKLLYVIDTSDPGGFLERGGLTVFGGIIGGILGAWIYFRLRKVPFGPLADVAAPGVAVAQVVGRIACTINGCCYGKPTSLPWGFVYTHPGSEAPLNVAVHPTQAYEMLLNLALFAVIFWILRGRLKPAGSLMLAYLTLYSMGTFGIRFLRGDTQSFLGSLQEAQVVSLIIAAGATFFFVTKTRWVTKGGTAARAGAPE